jgi:glycosyltransferase involved in cell wall biosynthesis
MPPITALLHTRNDALRLGRCLETLHPCDEILIVDHHSGDGTARIAREYGARVIDDASGASPVPNLGGVDSAWLLCLDPRESLTESLATSLYEWKSLVAPAAPAFAVFLRQETPEGWIEMPEPQTRLVPPNWNRWNQTLPAHDASSLPLEGRLLRFAFP